MPVDEQSQMKLRLPAELRERIEIVAHNARRSLNAEIVDRLTRSFDFERQLQFLRQKTDSDGEELFRIKQQLDEPNKRLIEATIVAESLRDNLTKKIETYERLAAGISKREEELEAREAAVEQSIEAQLAERRAEMEADYEATMKIIEEQRKSANDYADFTIARERQFYETIKQITGVEPPPIDEDAMRIREARLPRKDTNERS